MLLYIQMVIGRIDKQCTRHSLCGIPGANGKARFSQKPCCGIVVHGGKYLPLRLGSLELEWTLVSNGKLPVVEPKGDGSAGNYAADPVVLGQLDKEGYHFRR